MLHATHLRDVLVPAHSDRFVFGYRLSLEFKESMDIQVANKRLGSAARPHLLDIPLHATIYAPRFGHCIPIFVPCAMQP